MRATVQYEGMLPGLNRTKVELKQWLRSQSTSHRSRFESNQSGIETIVTMMFASLAIRFESNQSGIETLLHRLQESLRKLV